MHVRSRAKSLAAVAALLLACGPTKVTQKHVNGVLPESITVDDPASLAGTWGSVVELATILTVPVLGDRNAGSIQTWLHRRTWNAAAGRFDETVRWCSMDVYEVEGSKLTIPEAAVRGHTAMTFASTVDGPRGLYGVAHILDLWGLRGLPDPENSPMPTSRDHAMPPQSDWVFDEDGDGEPGVTGTTTGAPAGTVCVVTRGQHAVRGAVVDPDRIQGLVTMKRFEQNTLKSDNPIAVGEGVVRQDADERLTWFDMIRLPDGATCDDVVRAQDEGRLAKKRPF